MLGSSASLEHRVKQALQGKPHTNGKVPSPVPSLLPGLAASTLC